MINKKIADAFNQQIKHELDSYYLYYSMAAFFHSIKLYGMAHWMKAQAGEEQGHVIRLIEYLKEQNSKMQLLVLSQLKVEWTSPLEVFTEAFQHEQFISGKINDLVKLAALENDIPATTMIQCFVAEQVKVEASISKIACTLKKLDICGSGLEILDQQLGARNKPNIYYLSFPKVTTVVTKPF